MFCINCKKSSVRASLNCEQCARQLCNQEYEHELEQELELFVSKQYPFYKRQWNRQRKRQLRWSWNGAAAFFSVIWLGYRRQYKIAFLFLLILIAADAVSYYIGWNYGLPVVNTTPITFLFFLFGVAALGLFANEWYYKQAIRHIYRLKAKGITDEAAERYLLRDVGGTSRLGATLLLVISILVSWGSHKLFPTDIDIVNAVRGGSLYNYPLYSIGESFEQYFYDPSWHYNRVPDGLELVEFHGYIAGAEQERVVIQFLVDYHLQEIEPYSLERNGVIQEEENFYELMDSVYSVQTPFELEDDLDEGSEKNAL